MFSSVRLLLTNTLWANTTITLKSADTWPGAGLWGQHLGDVARRIHCTTHVCGGFDGLRFLKVQCVAVHTQGFVLNKYWRNVAFLWHYWVSSWLLEWLFSSTGTCSGTLSPCCILSPWAMSPHSGGGDGWRVEMLSLPSTICTTVSSDYQLPAEYISF